MSDTITIRGNIAADPERRRTGAGVPVTAFRVASSQRHFDRAKGEWVESGTNWYAVSAFRALGEHAFASLRKGQRVIVTGRLRLRPWETANSKGISVEIDADGIGHDLLFGTTEYTRDAASSDAASAPPPSGWARAADADAQPTHAAPGDWGAPAGETGEPSAPGAAEDELRRAADDGAREGELLDAPF